MTEVRIHIYEETKSDILNKIVDDFWDRLDVYNIDDFTIEIDEISIKNDCSCPQATVCGDNNGYCEFFNKNDETCVYGEI